MTQKAVAKLCGVDECKVTNWEKIHSQPRLYLLSKIIKLLGYVRNNPSSKTFDNKRLSI
jgi:hypothetical protein